ncbi:MAG: HNH endonuclease [Candidatus Altiarchaeales archaeon HGW-Altiarchaeales-1]|nr:MAG: HNH endonuclease [Candidatus Altiarchaeales archaeon HGW-Altiarchaeales-1]
MSENIPLTDIKILCIRSGNRCAFPGCNTILVQNSTQFDKESIIGEITHIKGKRPGSARYDPAMSDKERNSYNNLILLCNNHHQLIDDQKMTYTIEKLHAIKNQHEKWVIESRDKEVINVTFSELNVVTKYLVSGQVILDDSYTIIPPKEKIKKNELSSTTEQSITIGLIQVKQVSQFIDKCPDIEFGERLKQGFVTEYKRLKNEECLKGDDLFNALLDFASGGNNDFIYKAAGLSVLVYLFEKCEVFEK